MKNECSYIANYSEETLKKYELNSRDVDVIKYLVNKAIDEELYTNTLDYQHNLKHIERVIAYARMIMKKMNNSLVNEEILMYASLYHDIGKNIAKTNKKVSEKEHGIEGAILFKKMMQGKMDERKINCICILISQHALEEDMINFINTDYTSLEQQSLQLMSNILKDSDNLDRNRLNYPAPTGKCDIKKLRTNEAKELFKITDDFYKDYNFSIIKEKERKSQSKILDNYSLLDEWIHSYQKLIYMKNSLIDNYYLLKNKYGLDEVKIDHNNEIDYAAMNSMFNQINDKNSFYSSTELVNWLEKYKEYRNQLKNNMYHASLDPSIDILIPSRSTQPGVEYVFAGINPINCFSMASFRSSTIFPRIGHGKGIREIFPGTINETLGKKYISIYKLPGETFNEYGDNIMKAPGGECVSKEKVKPEKQVTFEFNDLMKRFEESGLYTIEKKANEQDIIASLVETFRQQYMWQIKDLNKNPNLLEDAWKNLGNIINYYCSEYYDLFLKIKESICEDVKKYTEEYIKEFGKMPDYSSEKDKIVYQKIYTSFINKYYVIDKSTEKRTINFDYIQSLKENENMLHTI